VCERKPSNLAKGRDLSIHLGFAKGIKHKFVFTWVDHFRILIEQQKVGPSQPLSWEGSASTKADGRLKVQIVNRGG
jgi:hypothetical protein